MLHESEWPSCRSDHQRLYNSGRRVDRWKHRNQRAPRWRDRDDGAAVRRAHVDAAPTTGASASQSITTTTGIVSTIAAVRASTGAVASIALDDTNSVVPPGATKVRVIHFAPNGGTLQVFRTQPDFQQPISWQFPFTYQATPDPERSVLSEHRRHLGSAHLANTGRCVRLGERTGEGRHPALERTEENGRDSRQAWRRRAGRNDLASRTRGQAPRVPNASRKSSSSRRRRPPSHPRRRSSGPQWWMTDLVANLQTALTGHVRPRARARGRRNVARLPGERGSARAAASSSRCSPANLTIDLSAERFAREIQLAAALQHPCIVPVLAAGVAGGVPFYTMPFVAGRTLRDRLVERTQLAVPEAMDDSARRRIGARACARARHRASRHQAGEHSSLGRLRAGHRLRHRARDLGVANPADIDRARITQAGLVIGSPSYMAPEQVAGDDGHGSTRGHLRAWLSGVRAVRWRAAVRARPIRT